MKQFFLILRELKVGNKNNKYSGGLRKLELESSEFSNVS